MPFGADDKNFGKKAWDFLGSRNLSVFIFIMALTYIFFLVIFGIFVPLPWVSNISKLLPFKVLYLLFFINLIICEIKWMPSILLKCRKFKVPDSTEDMGRFRHRMKLEIAECRTGNLAKYLRRRGYRVKSLESGVRSINREAGMLESSNLKFSGVSPRVSPVLYAYKGRFSPIGNLLFHFSFLVLLIGIGVSLLFRFAGSVRVPESFDFTGSIGEYTIFSPSPLSSLPQLNFTLDKIEPRFWKMKLLFTDLRADIKSAEGIGSAWMSSPLTINGAKITINSIGITPMYLLKSKDGKELDSGYVNLAAFAPGTEDHFQIPGYPHQIFISFYPDYEVRDRVPMIRSMYLKNPAYFVRIFRGRLLLFSGLLKPSEEAEFDNLRLSLPEVRYWGDLRIVRDPGFLFIWTAFIFLGMGLVWRFIFYRKEIVVVKDGDQTYLMGNSEFFPRLFGNRLVLLASMIIGKNEDRPELKIDA